MHLGLHGPHTSMRLFHTLLQVPNWVKNCLCSPFVGTQHFLRIRFSAPAYRKTNHKFFKNNAQKSKVNFYIFTWGFDVLSILIYLYKSRILGLLWSHLVLGQHRASITKREKEWYAGDCIKNTRTLDFTSCPARVTVYVSKRRHLSMTNMLSYWYPTLRIIYFVLKRVNSHSRFHPKTYGFQNPNNPSLLVEQNDLLASNPLCTGPEDCCDPVWWITNCGKTSPRINQLRFIYW